jgi:small subunit ribosomal protein S8
VSMTDPIADMLTRIRNACMSAHSELDVLASNMNEDIAKILQAEGYIVGYVRVEDGRQGILKLTLKYNAQKQSAIMGLKRISTPGRRVYVGRKDIPKVLNGLGIAIISTSRGVMTGGQSAKTHVGGEVLCHVW